MQAVAFVWDEASIAPMAEELGALALEAQTVYRLDALLLTLPVFALEMGGHCRTGLEDNIRLDRDTLAPSNAALVAHVAKMAAEHGRPVASARQARQMLGLPASPTALA